VLSTEPFATVYEQHRRVLRRQAGRLLRGTGLDPDDVLQDVYLRAHGALESGVVPIEPRAWLLRLVRNACLDELRRLKARPVGDVVLEAVPSSATGLPDELSNRAEARALLGDMQRLPDRQKSVLVLSALDGLSHEEVADRLDTTVNTTRSLLARARANLRQTAIARETACESVELALEEAAVHGVRASEIARRHLWSCADCRGFQRDLRTTPSRLRRLATWSPWAVVAQVLSGGSKAAVGVCCALVVGGGAVTMPVVEQIRHSPPATVDVASAEDTGDLPAPKPARKPKSSQQVARTGVPVPVVHTTSTSAAVKPASVAQPAKKLARRAPRRPYAISASATERQFKYAIRAFASRQATDEERTTVLAAVRAYRSAPPGSAERLRALRRLQRAAYGFRPPVLPPAPPRKGNPAPVSTPTPQPTPEKTPSPRPVETPTPTATPIVVAAPSATPTPVPTETATPTPEPTVTVTPTPTA